MLCDRIAVMSAAPGVVKSVVAVDVARPRNFRSMRNPDFGRCMERVWDLLRYDVDKAMRENHPSKTAQEEGSRRGKPFFNWWD